MVPPISDSEESAVIDFAVELFRRIGYVGRRRYACTRKDLSPLPGTRHAKTDACIVDHLRHVNRILLVIQEVERCGEHASFTDM